MRAIGPAGDICWGGMEVGRMDGDSWEDSEGVPEVGGVEAAAAEGGAGGKGPVWHWMTGGCWPWRICCCAEESESLSLSRGLGMLGEELRLSWSMSLGSLLPSSFTLRPSELSPSPSPSEGESGRSCKWWKEGERVNKLGERVNKLGHSGSY